MWQPRILKRRKIERERVALERRCASIVGDALTRVTYMELGDEELWNTYPDYDSVEGAELTMRSGRSVAIQWDYAIVDFGMNIVEDKAAWKKFPRHDVSHSSRWRDMFGRTITECGVIWKPDEDDDYNDSLPQTIRLGFEGSRLVFLTASEFDRDFDWGADNVSVFFDAEWERSDLSRRAHPFFD